MTPNPIRKVLGTLCCHRVRFLLMGGQACVLYGAAEFSRDTDIVILADTANLNRLRAALRDLDAEPIAVPELTLDHLRRGHAVHFRCRCRDADGIRIDVMSVLRGVAAFPALWKRRTTLTLAPGERYDLLALPDLVQAKKTQRDKDWPMLRRLIEAHYVQNRAHPTRPQVRFWLREARTPAILLELAEASAHQLRRLERQRPLLAFARTRCLPDLEKALATEEQREREQDRAYWEPLRHELEQMRHGRCRKLRRPAAPPNRN